MQHKATTTLQAMVTSLKFLNLRSIILKTSTVTCNTCLQAYMFVCGVWSCSIEEASVGPACCPAPPLVPEGCVTSVSSLARCWMHLTGCPKSSSFERMLTGEVEMGWCHRRGLAWVRRTGAHRTLTAKPIATEFEVALHYGAWFASAPTSVPTSTMSLKSGHAYRRDRADLHVESHRNLYHADCNARDFEKNLFRSLRCCALAPDASCLLHLTQDLSPGLQSRHIVICTSVPHSQQTPPS